MSYRLESLCIVSVILPLCSVDQLQSEYYDKHGDWASSKAAESDGFAFSVLKQWNYKCDRFTEVRKTK